jgi:peptidoglycan/xylan/chitin deacetylase (PgdA/CDA1 family)
MLVRAFFLFVAVFYFSAARATECNYSEQGGFLSRVLAVDSSGGAVYRTVKAASGTASAPSPLELHDKEVLLVFDQGPNPAYTRYILDILDHRCAKAVFFFAGNAALANPDSVRDVARRGHTIAAGPWSTAPNLASLSGEGTQAEIEKGFAAVAKAAGGEVAPFFSAPGQTLPPSTLDYLKERGVSVWPVDVVSGDVEPGLTPTKLANRTLERVAEAGKGILEFHDTRKVTVDALDSILVNLKANGFKLVQILPAGNFAPKDEYLTNPAKTPATVAASPSSGVFIEEAKRRVQMTEARQAALQRRIAEARQEATEQRARQETMERRARQEAADRRARQEAAERRAQTRPAARGYTQLWQQQVDERPDVGARQEAMQRREAAERRAAQARYAGQMERRNAQLRHEAALRRARQEAAERRAQARSGDGTERRRTAQRPD